MKLLFDQNISSRILKKISEAYSDSSHVKLEGLKNASDSKIWDHANLHHFIIVTQASDFNDIFLLKGFPPKILWFRTGNEIQDFVENNELGCLEFSRIKI